jgi:hypothetical protein
MYIFLTQLVILGNTVNEALSYIQFFLKNHAKRYAEPKIAIIVTNPATESTAIPERAAPLVQPLAS